MICTVNDIRVRLGNYMKNILCDELDTIYKGFSTDIPEKVMLEFSDDADNLILELSEHLTDQKYWIKAIASKKAEVFFTFFMRYNMLTQYLVSRNQTTKANVPDDDKEFFVVMMTDFWELALDSLF